MKYSILTLAMIIFHATAFDGPRLTAVTSFGTLMEMYKKLRTNEPPSDEDAEDLPNLKKVTCKDITSSHYFSLMEFEYVDPGRIFKILKSRKHDKTFKELFEEDREIEDGVTGKYKYVNKYALRTIYLPESEEIPDVFDLNPPTSSRADSMDVSHLGRRGGVDEKAGPKEQVFLCLTKKRSTPIGSSFLQLQKWYVSKAYRMGENEVSKREIVGRFVFRSGNKSIKLIALADEAAQEYLPDINNDFNPDRYYLNVLRHEREPTKESNMDPLCKLTTVPDQHIRLCNAILSSSSFINHVHEIELHEIGCTLLEVGFTTPSIENRVDGSQYFEWMVSCKAEEFATKNIVTYFISRAYKPNMVVVYEKRKFRSTEKVFLIGICLNVNIAA